jgi:UPF0755 protein
VNIKKFIFLFSVAVFFFAFLLAHLMFFESFYRQSNEEITVKITPGGNLRSVATELEEEGVIYNRYIFIAAGRLLGYQNEIIPGEYSFRNGLTNLDVLKMITNPNLTRGYTVTIPEGLNIRQIAHLLSRKLDIDSAKFVMETYNDSLIYLLGVKADNLEGYLFPDTYRFSLNRKENVEREIVSTMAAKFRREMMPNVVDTIKKKRLNLKEVITMASIVEGETRYEPEKKIIAGVYYNRLKRHMKLEADPTVQFALPDGPKKRLSYSDLKYPSPYNTYRVKGLPPGPINNPGMSSIMAAIHPDNNKYLYFVAKGDGTHKFAETFSEHKKNIELYKKYLKNLEEMKDNRK